MIFSKPTEKKTVKARSKPSEYEAMLRNGFILPKLNSTIVNKNYMYRVKSGQEYCPLTSEIKVFKICINPPSKYFLLNEIQQELITQGDVRDLSYDEKHLPDVEWCVKALLALNPGHRIFNKDYVPGINEKVRRGGGVGGQKNDSSLVEEEEEELPKFPDFESGLPSHLHLQQYACSSSQSRNIRINSQIPIPEKKNEMQMQMEDDTITEKEEDMLMKSHLLLEENQMNIYEPVNPFIKAGIQERILSNIKPDLQFSREKGFEILGQVQVQSKPHLQANPNLIQMSKGSLYKPSDLQTTLKQLNNSLFSNPAISKNKSKKNLTSQEEELIVKMFEKLVVNCKGRPVDFVKTYLDQYHSEKSINSGKESIVQSSKNFQQNCSGTSFNFNQASVSAPASKNKISSYQTSPPKSKNFNFGQNCTQASSFNIGTHLDENFQSPSQSLTENQHLGSQSHAIDFKSSKQHFQEDVKMKQQFVSNGQNQTNTYLGQNESEFGTSDQNVLNQYEISQSTNAYSFEKQRQRQEQQTFDEHGQQTTGYSQNQSEDYASANEQQVFNQATQQQPVHMHDKMQFII